MREQDRVGCDQWEERWWRTSKQLFKNHLGRPLPVFARSPHHHALFISLPREEYVCSFVTFLSHLHPKIRLDPRVHQNSKKFSKSHGLLIYSVPTCILAISAKKMIFFAFSWLGHHFEKNGPCSWENKVKICKILNLLISHRKVVNTWNKCLIHHFGGVLAWKSGLNFWIWALKVPFSAT